MLSFYKLRYQEVIPSHITPPKPELQVHTKLPTVLTQVEVAGQLVVPSVHSLISTIIDKLNELNSRQQVLWSSVIRI